MTLNYVALAITVQDAGEDAGTGGVLVAPTEAVTAAGVTVVSATPVSRQLSAGAVTISLVATDNSGTTPAAGFWAYQVTLPGGQPQTYLVDYANGASQRLDNLTPVVAKTTYGPAASSGSGFANPMTALGDIIYESAAPAAARLAGNVTSTRKFLRQAGTGLVSAAPAWDTLVAGDIPDLSASYLDGTGGVPSAKLAPKVVTLADGSSVAVDASAGNVFTWALGGSSHTLAAPSSPVDGQVITVKIRYGGSFTPLFNAVYDFAGNAPAWSAASGKTDRVAFAYDAAANSGAGSWECLNSGGLGYTS